MLESMSDYLSFAILMAFPISCIVYAIRCLWKRRQIKLLANQEKFYREW